MIKKVVIIILSNNFQWTIVRLHIGSVALLYRGHPEITCPSLSLFQLFQLFPFSYRPGKHFSVCGICCSEGEIFSLFKVQNHRVAQFGKELGGNHLVSNEFRWNYLAPWPILSWKLPVRGTLPCPGEETKHEELFSFPQLWNVGVNPLSQKSCLGETPPFLLSHFLHPNKAAIHKEIYIEDENKWGRRWRLGEQRKWLFLRGRESDCSGNNYTCYLINGVSSIYYVARTCLVSMRK